MEHLLLALRVEVMPFANTNCTGPWKAGAATARVATLLFKGDDFAATDVAPALES